jgi:hypothetical protein
VLLADNLAAYTLEITPNQRAEHRPHDRRPVALIEIAARDRRRFKRLLEDARSYEPIPIKHPRQRRGAGALRGGEVPLPRGRDPCPALPHLPDGPRPRRT